MMNIFKKFLKILGIALVIFMIAGAFYQYVATKLDERKFPVIGTMVGIGGYKLHMLDSGIAAKDKPTIVLEAGLGGNFLSFSLVAPEIAKFARVISYDRAGQGWSDASLLPRTAENIVQDLHAMLHNANVEPPYILVGHSFGGVVVRLFAAHYPDEVAGMILVDASHENVFDHDDKSSRSILKQWYDRAKCYFNHYIGMERFEIEWNAWKHRNKPISKRSYRKTPMFVALKLSNKVMHAKISEHDNFPLSCQQLKRAQNGIENKPLTVISAGNLMWLQARRNEVWAQKWADLQVDLVTKSNFGKQMIAEKSGHDIMTDQPDIIVEAVREMYEEEI
jgi:pimeloyl-ACP methyl ester carboxylesterase